MMNKDKKMNLDIDAAQCGRYISFLYRKSSSHFAIEMKEIGLSASQSILLVGIYRFEGLNQRALADAISMTPPVASRTLRELEDQNYITKIRDEENRRNYRLYLTPEGGKKAEESLELQGKYWNSLVEPFSPEEIATLNRLLLEMERRAYEM